MREIWERPDKIQDAVKVLAALDAVTSSWVLCRDDRGCYGLCLAKS